MKTSAPAIANLSTKSTIKIIIIKEKRKQKKMIVNNKYYSFLDAQCTHIINAHQHKGLVVVVVFFAVTKWVIVIMRNENIVHNK